MHPYLQEELKCILYYLKGHLIKYFFIMTLYQIGGGGLKHRKVLMSEIWQSFHKKQTNGTDVPERCLVR